MSKHMASSVWWKYFYKEPETKYGLANAIKITFSNTQNHSVDSLTPRRTREFKKNS